MALLVTSCARVRGGCTFGCGDVSVHRCGGFDPLRRSQLRQRASDTYLTCHAATLAAIAETEFLKHKKIGANGVDIAISPADILLSQLVVVSDLEQVLSKQVGLGLADNGGVSVLSRLPERVGVCVAFPALICECHEGAASVAAVFFEPD